MTLSNPFEDDFSDEVRDMLESLEPDNVEAYTIAIGHAFSGITLQGLYEDFEEAREAADRIIHEDWNIVPIYTT